MFIAAAVIYFQVYFQEIRSVELSVDTCVAKFVV